ncbi:MAG TPA: type II CAAX endopeptidase family protein [Myxococcaceae bacterium]|nr:type II CAAX endopeptidase family protein [Myxococcaceae bacterium]
MLEPTVPPQSPPVPPERLGVLAFIVGMSLYYTLGSMLQWVDLGAGLWFGQIFLLFGIGWALTRWSGREPAAYVGLRWPGLWPVGLALAISVANYFAVIIPVQLAVRLVAPSSWVELFDQTQIFERRTSLELALAVTAAVAAAPIGEEMVFRGLFLQGMLRRGVSLVPAVLASALVFAFSHINPLAFPSLLELGVVFGLLFARTRSVWPSMFAHLGSNLTATLLYSASKGQSAPADLDLAAELPSLLFFAALGWMALAGLLLLARRAPGAWGGLPGEERLSPPVPFFRAYRPWAVAGGLTLLVWGVVDRKGIEIEVADVRARLPPPRSGEPDWARARREELEALRDEVRRGSATLDTYVRERRALARALERSKADAGAPAD